MEENTGRMYNKEVAFLRKIRLCSGDKVTRDRFITNPRACINILRKVTVELKYKYALLCLVILIKFFAVKKLYINVKYFRVR